MAGGDHATPDAREFCYGMRKPEEFLLRLGMRTGMKKGAHCKRREGLDGEPWGNRTLNLLIKSQLLYQLS